LCWKISAIAFNITRATGAIALSSTPGPPPPPPPPPPPHHRQHLIAVPARHPNRNHASEKSLIGGSGLNTHASNDDARDQIRDQIRDQDAMGQNGTG
jgi:hypothetical protein